MSSAKTTDITKTQLLTKFGFIFDKGGPHSARTMMLTELQDLIDYVNEPSAESAMYKSAVIDENCLKKRSVNTRRLTIDFLRRLYGLDTKTPLFRVLLYLWSRDPVGRPLLALLCASVRDGILRMANPYMLRQQHGILVPTPTVNAFIVSQHPDRFSQATSRSIAQNLRSTWTQSGHLSGKVNKIRTKAKASPGSVAYALLLGFLSGVRGESLFSTDYAKLLDCSRDEAYRLARDASQKGWIVFKQIGSVVEVLFPNLLTTEELELLHEQNQTPA